MLENSVDERTAILLWVARRAEQSQVLQSWLAVDCWLTLLAAAVPGLPWEPSTSDDHWLLDGFGPLRDQLVVKGLTVGLRPSRPVNVLERGRQALAPWQERLDRALGPTWTQLADRLPNHNLVRLQRYALVAASAWQAARQAGTKLDRDELAAALAATRQLGRDQALHLEGCWLNLCRISPPWFVAAPNTLPVLPGGPEQPDGT